MMMEGYFDESGIHAKARVCLVAGFYGDQDAWRGFEDRWKSIMADYPELGDEGFHAKRFYGRKTGNRVGKYANWSNEKADKFLDRIVSCIVSCRIYPIGYGLIVEDFLALPLMDRQWLTGARFSKTTGEAKTSGCPNKPYYLPFNFCVLKSAEKSTATSIDKINIFVGLDRTFHGYASSLYKYLLVDDRLSEKLRSCLGTLANPLAKDTPGLQAADLLAYVMYDASLVALTNPPKYQPPALLMRLLKNWQGKPALKLMNKGIFEAMEREGRKAYEKMIREQKVQHTT